MKTISYLAATAMLALAACSQSQPADDAATSSSETTVTTSTTETAAAPAAGDAASSSAPAAGGMATPDFARQAAMSTLLMQQIGQAGVARLQNSGIRGMAGTSSAYPNSALQTALTTGGVTATLPTDLDAAGMARVAALNATPAAEFDAAYLREQIAAMDAARTASEAYAASGETPAVREWAQRQATDYADSLRMLRGMQSSQHLG